MFSSFQIINRLEKGVLYDPYNDYNCLGNLI